MYTPTLGRFMSRDPLQADADLLSDNNWFGQNLDAMEAQLYAYVRSNPLNRTDPSGQQAAAAPGVPDVCEDCECHKASILWDHRDIIDVPGRRKCRVEITCQKGACNGLPGFTGVPALKQNAQGKAEWVIPLCVQCGWEPINLIFEHELVHALQFCSGKEIKNCRSCKDLETEAHKKNCKMAFPDPNQQDLYERCYRCGANISCRKICGNRDPYPQTKNCTLADLGVSQPPVE